MLPVAQCPKTMALGILFNFMIVYDGGLYRDSSYSTLLAHGVFFFITSFKLR